MADERESPSRRFVMERYAPLHKTGRSFDIEYWQRLGPEAIFEAAWKMVVEAHSANPDELRLRRSVENYRALRG
jgi:hypothetical protein